MSVKSFMHNVRPCFKIMRGRVNSVQKQPLTDVLKNFVNFAGKHLCWSLSLIKLQALRPATLLKETQT